MQRKIPIEWLEEWARITDNEELMEVLVGDWTKEWFDKPFSFSEDKLIRDDVILRTHNVDNQFDPDLRRHYFVLLTAEDYDAEKDITRETVLYQCIQHFTQKELAEFGRAQTVTKVGDHERVYFTAYPREFTMFECFHNEYVSDNLQKNTKVSGDGQIGFRL
jgi:hypothetical protein